MINNLQLILITINIVYYCVLDTEIYIIYSNTIKSEILLYIIHRHTKYFYIFYLITNNLRIMFTRFLIYKIN